MGTLRHIDESSIRETAALWRERLSCEGVSAQMRAEFEGWLAASARHRELYEEVSSTWKDLQSLAQDPQILALRHETALRLTRGTSRLLRPLAAAAMVIMAVAVTPFAFQFWPHGGLKPAPDRYVTAVGERLNVTLSDGSEVTLNSGTELKPVFVANERKVLLLRGQALFEVAKESARPFVVEAANQRFIALGTAFDVRVDGERVQLTMLEGTVKVEREKSAEILTAGQQFIGAVRSDSRVRTANADRVTAWRRGQVIFENSRLADAVAELNRYSETRIELADPELGELKLSGAFATGRPSLFVEAVTQYFPVEAVRTDGRTIVLRPRR